MQGGLVSDTNQKPFHLKSVIERDKNGEITKINVVSSDRPQFHTPAYDELLKNPLPSWLRRQAK
jgi:hypothetical protein